jgi:hypothetical protein
MFAVSALILPLIHYKNGLLFSVYFLFILIFCKEYGNVAITNKIKLVTNRRYLYNYILVPVKRVPICCYQCLTAKQNALSGASLVYGNSFSIKFLLMHYCTTNLTWR